MDQVENHDEHISPNRSEDHGDEPTANPADEVEVVQDYPDNNGNEMDAGADIRQKRKRGRSKRRR